MKAQTAIRIRDEALERLSDEQRRRLADELTLLGRISSSSKPDAFCGAAIQDACIRLRKELGRVPRTAGQT